MTVPDLRLSTSAAGAMRSFGDPLAAAVVGGMLIGFGTSAGLAPDRIPSGARWPAQQTNAGILADIAEPVGAGIAELRRLTAFTWDQLARLFSVSRRSLHFWASGKAMTQSNEEHLQRLLAVVRKVDRGSASANRAALLAVREDGSIPFDLLASQQYGRVAELLGSGEFRRLDVPRPSAEAMAARTPRPPEELVGALQDRIHREMGTARAAKSVRVRSGR